MPVNLGTLGECFRDYESFKRLLLSGFYRHLIPCFNFVF